METRNLETRSSRGRGECYRRVLLIMLIAAVPGEKKREQYWGAGSIAGNPFNGC